jgi:hypothetical protein
LWFSTRIPGISDTDHPGHGLCRHKGRWRGFGLGVALAGTALRHLAAAARAVVCYPMPLLNPTTRGDELDEQVAVACMIEVWEQLSFDHAHDGLFVLDLTTDTLDNTLHHLRLRVTSTATMDG